MGVIKPRLISPLYPPTRAMNSLQSTTGLGASSQPWTMAHLSCSHLLLLQGSMGIGATANLSAVRSFLPLLLLFVRNENMSTLNLRTVSQVVDFIWESLRGFKGLDGLLRTDSGINSQVSITRFCVFWVSSRKKCTRWIKMGMGLKVYLVSPLRRIYLPVIAFLGEICRTEEVGK